VSLPRILVVHCAAALPGGVDATVAAEIALLQSHGHALDVLSHGDDWQPSGGVRQCDSGWPARGAQVLRAAIGRFRPDVIHMHNVLPGFSPSLLWAAAERGVPVVQTLHDYQLACPQGGFLRADRVCQDCLGGPPLPAVRHACSNGSRRESLRASITLIAHRALGTWNRKVSRYIALSDFCREQFIRAGLPAARIRVKPNFTAAPLTVPQRAGTPTNADDFIYAGPLTQESGVIVLAQALLLDGGLSCLVAGDGSARAALGGVVGLRLGGMLEPSALSHQLQRAVAVVVPSLWYEPFSQMAIEAFGHGVPVIASRMGTLADIVRDGKTGLLFEAGNARDLARKLRWARDNPAQMQTMGRTARTTHARRYSAQENYRQLLAVYDDAITTTPF
jgi:glycosyltransferase involved in cell wall biosynthesis